MGNNIVFANNEWIEVTPRIKVSGPHHEVFLEGVVSTQPENDEEDIRMEEDGRIFVKRRNDSQEDRHFIMTFRVSVHGQETFTNTRVIVRNPDSQEKPA